jgi:lysophospholipase L1-like esterase
VVIRRLLYTGLALAVCCLVLAWARNDRKNPAAIPHPCDAPRHWQLLETAAKGDVDVLFLGDSLTQGWEWTGTQAWADTFAPLKAANFGIGGDQTCQVLWRITTGKELKGIDPRVTVLLIGTNNTSGHSAEEIAGGIEAIIKELHHQKPKMKVLLMGLFPRAGKELDKTVPEAKAEDLHPKIKQVNDLIEKLADGETVFYKDIGSKLLDRNGNLSRAIMYDFLHLSAKGYQIWTDAIKDDVLALTWDEDDKKNPAAVPLNRDVARHKQFLKIAAKGDVDVLFLGDSITQGWERNGKEAWAQSFAPLKAANFGISGDQTGHVLWRITTGKELDGIDPKVAVLMIGTNNAGRHTAEEIAGGIEAIVKELNRQKPKMKVLLLGVFPRSAKRLDKTTTEAKADELHPKIKQINDRIKKLDNGKTVVYKDIGSKFLDKDGNLPREIMPDYLHLSPKGYQIWADAIKDDVKKMLKE